MTVGLPNGAFVTSSRGFQKSKNSSDFSGGKEKVGPKFFEKPKRHKRTSRGKKIHTHIKKHLLKFFFPTGLLFVAKNQIATSSWVKGMKRIHHGWSKSFMSSLSPWFPHSFHQPTTWHHDILPHPFRSPAWQWQPPRDPQSIHTEGKKNLPKG